MTKYLVKIINTATKNNNNFYGVTNESMNIYNGVSIHYTGKGDRVSSVPVDYWAYTRKCDAERNIERCKEYDKTFDEMQNYAWEHRYEIVEIEA